MILFLLMSLFMNPSYAEAGPTCQDFFEPGSLFNIATKEPSTKYFNPWDGESVAKFLSLPKVVQSLRGINKDKDNLLIYEDHVLALEDAMKNLSSRVDNLETGRGFSGIEYKNKLKEEIQNIYSEIVMRRTQKKMTYYWLWTISFKASSVKEAFDNFNSKDFLVEMASMGLLDRLLFLNNIKTNGDRELLARVFTRNGTREISDGGLITAKNVLVMPVIGRNTYVDFLETENTMEMIATPLELQINHGKRRKEYSLAMNHDFEHASKNMLGRQRAGPGWPSIHEQIYSKIKELSGVDRIYTEFVYGFVLREFLNTRSEIMSIIDGTSPGPILDNDMSGYLFRRLQIFDDLGQDFPNIKDKQEIIDIGSKNLTRILDQMRVGS